MRDAPKENDGMESASADEAMDRVIAEMDEVQAWLLLADIESALVPLGVPTPEAKSPLALQARNAISGLFDTLGSTASWAGQLTLVPRPAPAYLDGGAEETMLTGSVVFDDPALQRALGWISPRLSLEVDPADGSAVVRVDRRREVGSRAGSLVVTLRAPDGQIRTARLTYGRPVSRNFEGGPLPGDVRTFDIQLAAASE